MLEAIKTKVMKEPNHLGYYDKFGGAFVPELLKPQLDELDENYKLIISSEEFQSVYHTLLSEYCGRPTSLFYSNYLSKKYNAKIYLKREDLNHTGSHKITNAIGQALIAKQLGKTNIIAETGAGQHGVATATICAKLKLKCTVYMGALDVERQQPNVQKMKMLGAEVVPVNSGNKTLKDATNEAIRQWIAHPDSYYLIGSVVGPHPYPDMVAKFQSIISKEIKDELKNPDRIIACVGGGSNAVGAFYHFIENDKVKLTVTEAAGKGVFSGESAATLTEGSEGVIHGSYTYLMQNSDGQIIEPYSISAGLDYPGIGPIHSHLFATKRIEVIPITDTEAVEAAFLLIKNEGIIPALESAHALAGLNKIEFFPDEVVVVNLSGRGDKDMATYLKHFNETSN